MNRKVLAGAILGLFVIFLVVSNCSGPHFEWNAYDSMRSDDDNPLGCKLFEKMAKATMPNGYEVYYDDLEELFHREEPFAMLVMDYTIFFDSDILLRLDSLVRKGNKLMIVANNAYDYNVDDEDDDGKDCKWLSKSEPYSSFNLDALKETLKGERNLVPIKMEQNGTINVPSTFLTSYIPPKNLKTTITATFSGKIEDTYDITPMPIAVKKKVGEGMVYQISCPLLMTNYGLFYHGIQKFQQSQMAQIADMPVVRVPSNKFHRSNSHRSYYEDNNNYTESPLAFMLERPPLRWALYTVFFAIILFMFFTARRRQRVIPLVERPRNRNIDFVKLLGTIYYRRHDNNDLARKKYVYFREELRRSLLIDIGDTTLDDENFKKLSRKTGLDEQHISQTVIQLRNLAGREYGEKVDDNELYDMIDNINEIIKHL